MSQSLQHYHRMLFQWHCRKFFRFRRHLTQLEKDYLETCFALADDFSETSESGYQHFSYYSYSHRVEGEQVNSSRLAYGSVSHPDQAWQAALPVLRERGLEVPAFLRESAVAVFYGLGWDILEHQFKVYFRVTRLQELQGALQNLLQGVCLEEHRDEGLVSYSYTRGVLSESKVYVYPLQARDLPEGVLGEARMLTDQRGQVSQYDLADSTPWRDRLNQTGQQILEAYLELDEHLDTISYTDRDHFTLYFP